MNAHKQREDARVLFLIGNGRICVARVAGGACFQTSRLHGKRPPHGIDAVTRGVGLSLLIRILAGNILCGIFIGVPAGLAVGRLPGICLGALFAGLVSAQVVTALAAHRTVHLHGSHRRALPGTARCRAARLKTQFVSMPGHYQTSVTVSRNFFLYFHLC